MALAGTSVRFGGADVVGDAVGGGEFCGDAVDGGGFFRFDGGAC